MSDQGGAGSEFHPARGYPAIIVVTLLFSLWLTSMALPVSTSVDKGDGPGWLILVTGWYGIIFLQFGWFANLIFPVSLLATLFRKPDQFELRCGVVLIILAASTLFWEVWPPRVSRFQITFGGGGYYCWMAAVIGGGVWLVLLGRRGGKRETYDKPI